MLPRASDRAASARGSCSDHLEELPDLRANSACLRDDRSASTGRSR